MTQMVKRAHTNLFFYGARDHNSDTATPSATNLQLEDEPIHLCSCLIQLPRRGIGDISGDAQDCHRTCTLIFLLAACLVRHVPVMKSKPSSLVFHLFAIHSSAAIEQTLSLLS